MFWRRRNARGNWTGANGSTEGAATPFHTDTFSSGTSSIGTRRDVNVRSVVQRALTSGENKGIYLYATGTAWSLNFHGRLAAVTADRPTLTVTTELGTFADLPCLATAWWSSSSSYSRDGRAEFSIQNGNNQAIVQFDLSSVLGANVLSATLSVKISWCAANQNYTIQVFEADPPRFHLAGTGTPTPGIASAYTNDKGLFAGHPDVLYARDFSGAANGTDYPWVQPAINGQPVPNTSSATAGIDGNQQSRITYTYDAATDSYEYNNYFRPGDQRAGVAFWPTPDSHDNNVVYGQRTGPTHDVLGFRYYCRIDAPWKPGEEMKWFGFDQRWGYCTGTASRYASVSGNGGDRGDGKLHWNATSNRYEFHGHSVRGQLGRPTVNPVGHPYDELVYLGNYVYHLGQATTWGDLQAWGYAEPLPGSINTCGNVPVPHVSTVVPLGRWVCIEQRMTMNTVSGTKDADGNCSIANFDGKLESWVDGVKVCERNNYRWTYHPFYGIHGIWWETWHGGTTKWPTTSPEGRFKGNHVVMTRNGVYIGPRG